MAPRACRPAVRAVPFPVRLLPVLVAAAVLPAGTSATAAQRAVAVAARSEEAGSHELTAPILELLRRREQQVRGLRGRADVRVSAGSWGGPSWLESAILAESPRRLRLRGYAGPSSLFDLNSDGDSLSLYLPQRDLLWVGPAQGLYELTGFPARPQELVDAILGRPFGTPDSLALVNADRDEITVRWRRPDGTRVRARFGRDPLLAREMTLERDGRDVLTLRYDDFLKESVGWWPRQVDLAWPGDDARLSLTFRQLELNPAFPAGAFRFTPPEGAVRIEVRGDGADSLWWQADR